MFRSILLVSLVALVAATLFAFTGSTGESEATAPGVNGRITFKRDNADVYSINPDGSGETQLTNDPA